MRISTVLNVFATFLLILSFFLLIPLFVGWYYNESGHGIPFLIPIGINVAVFLVIKGSTFRRERKELSAKGGFLFVTITWFGAAATGALPLFLSGAVPSYTDAYFEIMSGFTTTGASILTSIESLPHSILFWRSLTHWLGGMGIVVLTVAIFPLLGTGGFQLVKAEAPGPSVDKVTPRITSTAKILWTIYLVFTLAETLLLMAGGMNLFDSLTHTFGTLATGGFSPKNASVGYYQSAYIHNVITVFMLLAGVNFILYHRLIMGNLISVRKNSELKAYIGIFAVAVGIIAINLFRSEIYDSFGKALRFSGFQAASILTTTGYATADFDTWPAMSKIVLFVLMFIGGSSGSTGGGIKVVRIVTMFKLSVKELKYLIHPRGVFNIQLNGSSVRNDIIHVIAGFLFLYLLMLLVTAMVVASAGNDIVTSFSAALVTLGNIGPGFGRIGPTLNYAYMPSYVKWFLSFIMALGRLELYTILVLFTRRFWLR